MMTMYLFIFFAFLMLVTGVGVYDSWKKGAQQLIAFSSVAIVMLLMTTVVQANALV